MGMESAVVMAGVLTLGQVGADDAGLAEAWAPVEGRIMTRWADEVSPEVVLPEYPRPQFVRDQWVNLNGLWEYAVTDRDAQQPGGWPSQPAEWDGRILVPFPLESALSGVGRLLEPDEVLWYRRVVRVPREWDEQRVLLHFGAVDWETRVWVNGVQVGSHAGGYDPFTLEITGALKAGTHGQRGGHELVVAVRDPTDAGGQPRGKQVRKPSGIYYRRSSGIWQTVWMEPAPQAGWIVEASFAPNAASGWVDVRVAIEDGVECQVEVRDGERVVARETTERGRARVKIADPHLWSPEAPFLYDVTLRSGRAGGEEKGRRVLDEVHSYFALRDVSVGPDQHGVQRLLLNGEPVFHFGPLDQGFWPDGLYTAPTDEALRFDVEAVKRMGGNMLRKHVKVEPSRFYYWCDRLGVMVWQDMPSASVEMQQDHGTDAQRPRARGEWQGQFEQELAVIMRALQNHPSIVMWVPFNEGWGQSDLAWARKVVAGVKERDPTRLVNNASGWTDMGMGDVIDIHSYPGPSAPRVEADRAAVLGEFGGLGLPVSAHTWVDESNWGYVTYTDQAVLADAYLGLIERLPMLIARGLCAAVYTQTTDVEIEVNGWLTYDRAVWKVDPEQAQAAAMGLHGPVPQANVVLKCALDGTAAGEWRYTTDEPAEGWERVEFDDSAWSSGRGGFGTRGTPGAVIGTAWESGQIWLRRTVNIGPEGLHDPHLAIHHDEDAEVYVNGVLARSFTGWTTSYTFVRLGGDGPQTLKEGTNTIAVHCRQTDGGQYIDVGIVDLVRK